MFIRSFFKLFAGTAAVQIITLIFYPVLGRIYSPEDFGVFGFISSASIVLGIFASGQLQMAFPQLAENSSEADSLGEISILFSLSSCLLVALILKLGLAEAFDLSPNFWWLVPLFSFSLCLNEICKMWLVFLRNYGRSSLFVSSNRLSSSLFKVLFPGSLGLIYSEILVNLVLCFTFLGTRKINPFRKGFSLLSKYRKYPTFYTFGALSQSLQQELPIFVFRQLFSASVIGYYVMANRFTVQSILLISSSIVLLLANQRSDLMTTRQLKLEMKIIMKFGIPLSLGASLIMHFWGANLFGLFLGRQWTEVGKISSLLVLLTIPKMLFVPLYARFLKFGEVRVISIMRLIQILAAILLFYLCRSMDFYNLLAVYVFYDFVSDVFVVGLSYNFLKKIMDGKYESA